jgi:hypothetical protein
VPVPTQPFWIHQAVEYGLGLALVSFGSRSLTPVVPCAIGALILLNAAIARGPLAAFRGVPRKVHRLLDLGVVAVALLLAVQPVIEVESGARTLVAVVAAALAMLWWQTNFAEPVPRRARWRASRSSSADPGSAVAESAAAATSTSTLASAETSSSGSAETASGPITPQVDRAGELGRSAGRMVGQGVNAVRRRTRR